MGESAVATTDSRASFRFACPRCHGDLDDSGAAADCGSCGQSFACVDGIWRFLLESRHHQFAAFLEEYRAVRATEGWGRPDPAYFQSLPWVSRDDPQHRIWRIRARSYRAFVDRVLRPLEASHGRPLRILDLGAGNCWLAHRLAWRGHHVVAIDLSTDAIDGLGAVAWYGGTQNPDGASSRAEGEVGDRSSVCLVQAEFDRLPLAARQADLAIFNGSFHYSTGYATTLRETLRVLHAAGQIVVLDSPFYANAPSGVAMIHEREERFQQAHGFTGNRLLTESFLTLDRLRDLGARLDLRWRVEYPGGRWRTVLSRWRASLRGRREPASFPLVIGRSGRVPPPRVSHPRLMRAAVRLLLRLRLRLLQHDRYDRLVLETVHGAPILVLPGVFNPKLLRTGEFLVRVLDTQPIQPDSSVLDLGTGSGVGAVFAGRRARRVVAVDINPQAVQCAEFNLRLHRLENRCEVREGDLFGPVGGERFELVLFNPPFFRGEPRDALDRAWRATDVVERFAAQLGDHLTPNGHALVILSSDGEADAFLDAFRANDLSVELVAWHDLVNETLAVYRLGVTR